MRFGIRAESYYPFVITDFVIPYIRNDIPMGIILFENKQWDLKGEDTVWGDALKQVVDWASLILQGFLNRFRSF